MLHADVTAHEDIYLRSWIKLGASSSMSGHHIGMLELGPKVVIVKKGEHGAFLFSTYVFHAMPAYPVAEVVDPTGAGDSFAGGVLGYLARAGQVSLGNLKRGMVYGTIAASFTVSGFGTRALAAATREDFDLRLHEFESFVT